ncbi:MAG: UDP-N-acetylmuramoyl-tripeptide--D-alanyl-D-alanine ligase [Chitinophagaceae bacterium]|nr:MAG: UDP-N-acetylmuramoyl-tripeptide--D-alanyl-D-alanine ligase [Chitinophagaceae bacterium]
MSYYSIEDLYKIYLQHPQVQTDTRKLKTGDLYFALKGPHFNGNLFAIAALEAGASFAIVDEPIPNSFSFENKIIQVADVLSTLQALAKHHRQQFQIPFIAITGSNGKTTTKELVSAVLSSHFITYTTQGNLNNHIGVPLTILSIQSDAQMAVIEMGANHLNEIKSYCEYTLPNFGLINNCGKAHLEGFGSLEGVRKGKGELFDFIKTHHGSLFINADYDYLVQMSEGADTIISYGHEKGDLTGLAVSQKGMLQVNLTKGCNIDFVQTQLVGDYNLPNVLAAICIGLYFKVPESKIKAAIENYTPNNSRSQLVKWNDNDVILDAYNANPSSMKVAIDNFANILSTQKIICLGGMKELGADSMQEHQELIDYLRKFEWKQVVLVGGDFKGCSHPYLYFDQTEEAQKWLLAQQFQQHHILIKGSRGIQMEKIMA